MSKLRSELFGKLSVLSCGLSVIVPPLIYAIGQFFEWVESLESLGHACQMVFAGFLIGAVIFGVAGWRQKLAKIGLGIASSIVLCIIIYALIPMSAPNPGPNPETPNPTLNNEVSMVFLVSIERPF